MANISIKHRRLIFLILGIITVLWVIYLLKAVILPFATGLVLAYLLMPIISWTEKKLPRPGRWMQFKRISLILVTFILLAALVGGFSYFIVTAIVDATLILLHSAPDIIGRSLFQIQSWSEGLRQLFPPEIWQEIDKSLLEGGKLLGNSIRDAFMGGIISIPSTFSTILGFAALPFFLFYIMKDSEKLKRSFSSALSPVIARHTRNVVSIIENVLGRYLRAQLMLGLIVAYFAFIGLLVLKIQFAAALALLAGITELIPTLGPWIGGGVAVIVTLAVAPEKAIWVAVLFLSIQLVENYFLVPRVQSAYLHIHPAVMIVLLIFGAYIAGFWGLLLIAPFTATAVEIYKYIRQEYEPEPSQPPVK